ncbi:MAG: dienelactone hydrolase family protein [Saccharopolyspora sp.]|uniref:dienelactone hydrolase family protein n=1 Tax=Saccharopolyspora TaxID=1835 RepID=UPI00190D18FB|nr:MULTISPECIES: dienelactone hydrolase family protein [unclassified Saccharopolyspora]MBK0865497.1 dienelactone hydrolase family protein [Saccharopolyspora sp. HNM0986]MBQ6641387.1 dienelactone hydrolase family protein [Saccharopolyspora sp.]
MTESRTETLALTDGSTLRMTVAEPDNVVRGGLVVLHEARGVTGRVRSLVSSLADEGWLTVAPHLYHRDGTDELSDGHGDDQVNDQVQRLSGESILADSDAAFVWLTDRGVPADRQGVIGFDIGGSAALVVAGSRSLGAAVTVGGGGILEPLSDGLPALVEIAGELTCPWLGLYSELDPGIPAAEVGKLRDAAATARVATDVVHYARSDHRFDTDSSAAVEAWQRARNWFDTHLR